MSEITAGQLSDKLFQLLAIAGALDPKIAVAAAGIDAIKSLFAKTGELNSMMTQVYSETEATAPAVAKAVNDFYSGKSDALEASFKEHPGKVD